jgi:ubiquinone/menaquinone biosynthesis C-methylase UbiE
MAKDYVAVQYDLARRPITSYPAKLAQRLAHLHNISIGAKLLEVGAGRPDVLNGFRLAGMEVYGCDISKVSKVACKKENIPFEYVNLENGKLPYKSETFDVVYSKSVIEHMIDPLSFVTESFRVLKPGGILLILTPDWEANYKTFFDDFTHVRPMSRRSMNLLLAMLDPIEINTYRFRQLPLAWKYPVINKFCAFISLFVPVRTKKPFFRWSKELMLVGFARKKHKVI